MLKHRVGTTEACPEQECPLWEPGGAALSGRCAFEQVDLEGRPEFAAWLLGLREALESAPRQAESGTVRRLFNRLLNESQAD
jgi:hypothetical protein